jgi:hypothetical protein
VKDALDLPIQPLPSLRDGFWPLSQIVSTPEDEFIEDGNVREEYDEVVHFVGQRQDRPTPSFRVLRDVYEGYFVAVRPVDGDSHPVWIAQAKSDPNCNPEWPNCVLIQYFQPTSRWEHTDSIITAWKSRVRRDSVECMIKILVEQIAIIHDSIATYDNRES